MINIYHILLFVGSNQLLLYLLQILPRCTDIKENSRAWSTECKEEESGQSQSC